VVGPELKWGPGQGGRVGRARRLVVGCSRATCGRILLRVPLRRGKSRTEDGDERRAGGERDAMGRLVHDAVAPSEAERYDAF